MGKIPTHPFLTVAYFCRIGWEKNHQADLEFQTLPAEVWAWSGSWGGRRDAIFGGQSKWGAKAKLRKKSQNHPTHIIVNSYISIWWKISASTLFLLVFVFTTFPTFLKLIRLTWTVETVSLVCVALLNAACSDIAAFQVVHNFLTQHIMRCLFPGFEGDEFRHHKFSKEVIFRFATTVIFLMGDLYKIYHIQRE